MPVHCNRAGGRSRSRHCPCEARLRRRRRGYRARRVDQRGQDAAEDRPRRQAAQVAAPSAGSSVRHPGSDEAVRVVRGAARRKRVRRRSVRDAAGGRRARGCRRVGGVLGRDVFRNQRDACGRNLSDSVRAGAGDRAVARRQGSGRRRRNRAPHRLGRREPTVGVGGRDSGDAAGVARELPFRERESPRGD